MKILIVRLYRNPRFCKIENRLFSSFIKEIQRLVSFPNIIISLVAYIYGCGHLEGEIKDQQRGQKGPVIVGKDFKVG